MMHTTQTTTRPPMDRVRVNLTDIGRHVSLADYLPLMRPDHCRPAHWETCPDCGALCQRARETCCCD